jgi:hypothetical protein
MNNDEFHIKWNIDMLTLDIQDKRNQIFQLQAKCLHGVVKKKHRSYDGYSEPTEYYTDFSCEICNKHWTEKGSK